MPEKTIEELELELKELKRQNLLKELEAEKEKIALANKEEEEQKVKTLNENKEKEIEQLKNTIKTEILNDMQGVSKIEKEEKPEKQVTLSEQQKMFGRVQEHLGLKGITYEGLCMKYANAGFKGVR